jgi:hypothetical protein
LGLFRACSFLASFSLHEPNAEEDAGKVQAFLAEMEGIVMGHPLWAGASDQEIDRALEVYKPRCLLGSLVSFAWTPPFSSIGSACVFRASRNSS